MEKLRTVCWSVAFLVAVLLSATTAQALDRGPVGQFCPYPFCDTPPPPPS